MGRRLVGYWAMKTFAFKAAKIAIKTIVVLAVVNFVVDKLYFLADRQELWHIFKTLEEANQTKQYEIAHACLSTAFWAKTSLQDLPNEIDRLTCISSPTLDINWQKTEATIAPGFMSGGAVLRFRKIEGRWQCDGVVDWWMD